MLSKIFNKIKFLWNVYVRELPRLRLAKKILSTKPLEIVPNGVAEIHVLTSSKDYILLIWALKSFYWQSKRDYGLVIHDDGSLGQKEQNCLLVHFPFARLIVKNDADFELKEQLKDFPLCSNFRFSNHLAPKLFDFYHYANSDRILLLDSDVLFFDEPKELLTRIENSSYLLNTVNSDVASAYTVAVDQVFEQFHLTIPERFNSGLGLIHKQSITAVIIEQFLKTPGVLGHFWRIEQTLFMLCSTKWGVELLPEAYNVHLGKGIKGPVRHYVGAVRQQMYSEGMKTLIKQGIMSSPWNN